MMKRQHNVLSFWGSLQIQSYNLTMALHPLIMTKENPTQLRKIEFHSTADNLNQQHVE